MVSGKNGFWKNSRNLFLASASSRSTLEKTLSCNLFASGNPLRQELQWIPHFSHPDVLRLEAFAVHFRGDVPNTIFLFQGVVGARAYETIPHFYHANVFRLLPCTSEATFFSESFQSVVSKSPAQLPPAYLAGQPEMPGNTSIPN